VTAHAQDDGGHRQLGVFLLAPGTLAGVGPGVVAEAPAVDGPLELAPLLIAAA
jgi:hypothetical protein